MERPFDTQAALKALAHPGRLEFLFWLKYPEGFFGLTPPQAAVGVPAGLFQRGGLSQSAVSQHLAILHQAGLMRSRRVGNQILYSRHDENLTELKRWLAEHIHTGS